MFHIFFIHYSVDGFWVASGGIDFNVFLHHLRNKVISFPVNNSSDWECDTFRQVIFHPLNTKRVLHNKVKQTKKMALITFTF